MHLVSLQTYIPVQALKVFFEVYFVKMIIMNKETENVMYNIIQNIINLCKEKTEIHQI